MSGLDIPPTVPAAEVAEWSDDVDVLVLGFGIAGGCAAVSAAAAGARVLVLEKAAAAGGTTAMAGGHFYLGGAPPFRSPPATRTAPRRCTLPGRGVPRPRARQDPGLLRGQRRALRLARGPRVRVRAQLLPGQVVVPPGTEGLSLHRQREGLAVLRAGQAGPTGTFGPGSRRARRAAMVIDLLVKRADELGVQVRYETGATNLVVDDDGAVVGVRWKRFTETGAIRARAVVIAAGGFVMNPDMVAEHTRRWASRARPSTTAWWRPTSSATPTTTVWPSGWVNPSAGQRNSWTNSSSPPPPTRRRSCSPG